MDTTGGALEDADELLDELLAAALLDEGVLRLPRVFFGERVVFSGSSSENEKKKEKDE